MASSSLAPLLLVEHVGGVTVVSFAQSALTSDEVVHDLEEQLLALVDQTGAGKLLLSFRDVRYMSSAVLAILLKLTAKLAKVGGRLKLCCVGPGLREVFQAARLDRWFVINDHEASALDSF